MSSSLKSTDVARNSSNRWRSTVCTSCRPQSQGCLATASASTTQPCAAVGVAGGAGSPKLQAKSAAASEGDSRNCSVPGRSFCAPGAEGASAIAHKEGHPDPAACGDNIFGRQPSFGAAHPDDKGRKSEVLCEICGMASLKIFRRSHRGDDLIEETLAFLCPSRLIGCCFRGRRGSPTIGDTAHRLCRRRFSFFVSQSLVDEIRALR